MIGRFEGSDGARRLLEAIAAQTAVRHDRGLAQRIIDVARLRDYSAGEGLIEQNGVDNDVFFIVAGSTDILVKGVPVASRGVGAHVGEMAAIDPSATRSASVVAGPQGAVAVVLSEPDLSAIADEFPDLWRALAVELGDRLRQRGTLVRARNAVPKLFIGSSVEGLAVARALQEQLEHDAVEVRVWTDDVFSPGGSTAAELVKLAQESDFGVFVVRPDDVTRSRHAQTGAPRDNVVLELGMFLGLHGQHRALILRPRGEDVKIPTDLLGIAPLDYDPDRARTDPVGAVATAANQLRRLINDLGPR